MSCDFDPILLFGLDSHVRDLPDDGTMKVRISFAKTTKLYFCVCKLRKASVIRN